MARYYFDIYDGEAFARDDVGLECASREQVREQATSFLPNVAADELPEGNYRHFWVKVRDESGHYVFQASMIVIAEWIG